MSDRPNAVIAGSLAEIKFVKTRSVCQLVVEIPIEQSEGAIAKFGVPIPGREIPLALALLQASPGPAPASSGGGAGQNLPAPARDTVKSERAKAAYKAMPPMKRDVVDAVRLIKDETFQLWLARGAGLHPVGLERVAEADAELKVCLRISSKAEIGESREVNERWHTLLTTYLRDTGQMAEMRT